MQSQLTISGLESLIYAYSLKIRQDAKTKALHMMIPYMCKRTLQQKTVRPQTLMTRHTPHLHPYRTFLIFTYATVPQWLPLQRQTYQNTARLSCQWARPLHDRLASQPGVREGFAVLLGGSLPGCAARSLSFYSYEGGRHDHRGRLRITPQMISRGNNLACRYSEKVDIFRKLPTAMKSGQIKCYLTMSMLSFQ